MSPDTVYFLNDRNHSMGLVNDQQAVFHDNKLIISMDEEYPLLFVSVQEFHQIKYWISFVLTEIIHMT